MERDTTERDPTDPSIWYREELQALLELVAQEARRPGAAYGDRAIIALGLLHKKLTRAVEIAPGMMAS